MTCLHDSLTLPNYQVLPNRIMKASMSEALGDRVNAPDEGPTGKVHKRDTVVPEDLQ